MEGKDLNFDFINLYSELLGAVLDDSQGRTLSNYPPISFSRYGPLCSIGLELQGVKLMNKRRRVAVTSPRQSVMPYGGEKKDFNTASDEERSGKVGVAAVKEKEKTVSHVKPLRRRGQATESHRLAERARREKINERFRRLQSLVPGCDRSMGMAVMLDEIITYIQSLQNQVELLCMKLESSSFLQHLDIQINQINPATNIYEALKEGLILNNDSGASIISTQSFQHVPTASQKHISSCQGCV